MALNTDRQDGTERSDQPLTREDIELLRNKVDSSARLDLSYQNLRKIHLAYFDLQGANLCGADLSKANLRGTNLRGAEPGDGDRDTGDPESRRSLRTD